MPRKKKKVSRGPRNIHAHGEEYYKKREMDAYTDGTPSQEASKNNNRRLWKPIHTHEDRKKLHGKETK
jgi:hypothetical protein